MIRLTREPSGISSLGHDLPIDLRVDGAISAYPSPTQFLIRFTGSGVNPSGTNESFVVGGVQFTTDDTTDYTTTSFDNTGSNFFRARNAKLMFSANARFRSWAVYLIRSTEETRLVIKDTDNKSYADEELIFNIFGLSKTSGYTVTGSPGQQIPIRLWYQWWREADVSNIPTPLTEQFDAPVDTYGLVKLDAREAAKRAVRYIDALNIDDSEPRFDPMFSQNIFLRYGTYTFGEGCTAAYGEAFQTTNYRVINSLLQNTSGSMQPYTTGKRKWLTSRGKVMSENLNGYAWAAIYVDTQAAPFRLKRIYYDVAQMIIREVIWESPAPHSTGVWRVPLGGLNGVPVDIQGRVQRQTVTLLNPVGFGFVSGSETLDVRYVDLDCKVGEIYFMENLGSLRTFHFDRIESRNLGVVAEEWQSYNPESVNSETVQKVVGSEQVFRLTTDIIDTEGRKTIEELLETDYAYILTQQDGLPVTKRITFDRSDYTVKNRDAGLRVTIPFKYTTSRRVR
jgi:hypothetical protein